MHMPDFVQFGINIKWIYKVLRKVLFKIFFLFVCFLGNHPCNLRPKSVREECDTLHSHILKPCTAYYLLKIFIYLFILCEGEGLAAIRSRK